ncbi:MAG: hypothetical protein JNL74_17450, partial [Fibrobacteres bacterium]|nr:hypothetical protein [Fibrobacterota bacterium]
MSEQIERIFKESGISISEFTKEVPILILNKDGLIVDRLITKVIKDGAHELLEGLVSRHKNIRDVFNLPEELSIDAISKIEPKKYFPLLKKQHKTNEGIETYYTTFSLLWIRIFPGVEGKYIALIAMPKLLPNITERFNGGIFFIDKHNKLVLFNQSFYNNFSQTEPSPFGLLGKNVGEFLRSTPRQIQEDALKAVSLPPANSYKTFFEMDFISPNINLDYLILPSEQAHHSSSGLELSSSTENGLFASCSQSFDFKDDFRIVVDGYFSSGSLPCFIIGELVETTLYRDANGYLVGPNSNGTSIILKKAGYQVSIASMPELKENRECTVELIKCGSAFYYFIDSNLVLSYFDHDLLAREQSWVSLYLRNGNSCRVTKWYGAAKSNNTPAKRESIFVELRNGSESSFLMNRILSTYLASGMEDY